MVGADELYTIPVLHTSLHINCKLTLSDMAYKLYMYKWPRLLLRNVFAAKKLLPQSQMEVAGKDCDISDID
jgi:hypothetical protein